MVQQIPIIHPSNYMIVRREGTTWFFSGGGEVILNPRRLPVSLEVSDRLDHFGLTMSQAAVELFRLNGGRYGYYLVDMLRKRYFYCGCDRSDVFSKLVEIGAIVRDHGTP